MNEQIWLNDEISVPVEYLDYDGYPIQSEFLGYSESGQEIWLDTPSITST